jgi:DNA-binding NtrC family response regulator
VEHFVEMFSSRMKRHIHHIPSETMSAFSAYSWPGNIRELQNLVARAMILAQDGVLSNPLPASALPIPPQPSIEQASRNPEPPEQMTIRESERALILYTLQATRWRIGGPKGAAERLGLKRTTLMYRLKRLGIERPLRRAALPDDLTPPERPPSAVAV